jgi:hypothetical protein
MNRFNSHIGAAQDVNDSTDPDIKHVIADIAD